MKLKNFIISIILTFSLCGCVTTKISEEQVYFNKAIENDNNSQYEGAFIYYSKVIDLNKDNSLAYFKRATVSYKLKKIEQAIPIPFDMSIELICEYFIIIFLSNKIIFIYDTYIIS